MGERNNLVLYGNVGTGKTHLVTAIGIEACASKTVRVVPTAALVNQFGEAQKQGGANRLFKQLAKTDLLICDEWGYVLLNGLDQSCCLMLFLIATSRGV